MPAEWWDDREVAFDCPVCQHTVTARSVYLNLDVVERSGVTQAEWFLALHLERHLLYGTGQCAACDGSGWTWTDPDDDSDEIPEAVERCPNGCPDSDIIEWYLAGFSG